MENVPQVKLGIVAVSRASFPLELAVRRRKALVSAYRKKYGDIYECTQTIEFENDMLVAVDELNANGVEALIVYLGNFGPETPETLIGKYFQGPLMYVAAAEEDIAILAKDRGDAYCGMLNCSYNMKLRKIRGFVPDYPVGDAEDVSDMIHEYIPIANALVGLNNLKIITFGPRPSEFLACNAPIQPLYDLGVEITENSELDLYNAYLKHADDPRIKDVVRCMFDELGISDSKARMKEMAQYEVTLLDLIEEQKGSRKYVALANKCWPSFEDFFGFVPCYVNSRLTARGIPVSCEVDVFGALSEFIGTCITQETVTLLDVNNSVPKELYAQDIKEKYEYTLEETFMGFHCGNTPSCRLCKPQLKSHLIMARNRDPETVMGTIEGDIVPGEITFFRLQGNANCTLSAYIAQGEVLPVSTHSFGSIGIFAIPQMNRFYRHILVGKGYPHHGAVAFDHIGKTLWNVFQLLGIEDVAYNQPQGVLYPTESPF